jgi:cytochrome b
MNVVTKNKIIWSWPTRFLHWVVALSTLACYFIDGGDSLHEWLGYLAAFFIFVRLLWGFNAKDHAHFRHFPLHPSVVVKHLRQITNRTSPTEGHNPLASWTYIVIWLVIIALGVTGFMMGLDAYWGEDWLEELHEQIATALQVLIALHLIGIAYDSWRFRRKTWKAMFTGKMED